MTNGFSRISVEQALSIIEQEDPVIVDVRDPQAFDAGHLEGAVHLNNDTVSQFLDETNREQAIIVYCYHGNSSISAGQFLVEQGFGRVMSMDGGYEAWRQRP